MQEVYIEKFIEVLKNKTKLEKELEVKIENKGKNIFVDGEGDKEFIALKVLEAIDIGFSIERALLLKNENNIFQTLNIRDLTKRNDIHRIKGRLIGTEGKTLRTLKTLTNCAISVTDNQIGIIGDAESIKDAIISVTSLVQGSKQGNVYARLERQVKNKRLNPTNLKGIKNELESKRK